MNPLSKKLRSRVLWTLLFIFVVFTPVLIGYSRGYRIDDALGIIRTGGIYLHSDIANTAVFLDDEFLENNGALWRNTNVDSLLPDRYYRVRVQHEDYQSWVKVLKVRPEMMTEARVLMIPKEFEWTEITATSSIDVPGTLLDDESTSTEKVALVVENPEYMQLEEWFLGYKEQFEVEEATSTYEYIRGQRFPSTTYVSVIRFPNWLSDVASSSILIEKDMVRERDGIVTWLENGDLFALWARENDTLPYFFCIEVCKEQLGINWGDEILHYDFYPNRNDVVLLLTERGLYAVELDDRSERNIQIIIEEPNLDFRVEGDGTLTIFDGQTYWQTSL
jgi:hypothetical protein